MKTWVIKNNYMRECSKLDFGRYLFIKYEDLFDHRSEGMDKIFRFTGINGNLNKHVISINDKINISKNNNEGHHTLLKNIDNPTMAEFVKAAKSFGYDYND